MPGYPTPPGTRIAYELDGSVVFITNGVTRRQIDMHPNGIKAMNSEYGGGVFMNVAATDWNSSNFEYRYITVIFPSPRELTAIHAIQTQHQSSGQNTRSGIASVWVSPDSTNGIDGSWVMASNTYPGPAFWDSTNYAATVDAITGGAPAANQNDTSGWVNVPVEFREYDLSTNIMGYIIVSGSAVRQVKAVQIRSTTMIASFGTPRVFKLHLYGKEDTTAPTQRLEFWKAGSDLRIDGSDLWWEDMPRASSDELSFRVKNMSPSLTAEDIVITTEDANSTTSPDPQSFYTFSLDGVTWDNSLLPPNLAPGDISPEIFVRAVVPSNATLGRWSPRIKAEVGDWT